MPTLRTLFALILTLLFAVNLPLAAVAQQDSAPAQGSSAGAIGDPAAGNGASQTLEDILRRQRGETVDNAARARVVGDPDQAAGMAQQLGTLGGASDADVYRAIRFGSADVSVSNGGPGAGVLIQDNGIWWLEWREGPLSQYGGWLLLGTLALLALFLILVGRLRTHEPLSGVLIPRFTAVERFAHWTLAGSFVLLALTGLMTLFGRAYILPWMGHANYSLLATANKWIHNNVSWAFMLALVAVFIFWVLENIPNRHDLKWLAMGGGAFTKNSHPPAKKFNAGQKLIFWAVVVLGASISVSGLSLLFPFQMPLFGETFRFINESGVLEWLAFGPLPDTLAPHEEMQYAQLWHSIVGFIFIAIIIAHIYLGTVGMEGAFSAMSTGKVDAQWAKEHHNLWYDEVAEKSGLPPRESVHQAKAPPATPAE